MEQYKRESKELRQKQKYLVFEGVHKFSVNHSHNGLRRVVESQLLLPRPIRNRFHLSSDQLVCDVNIVNDVKDQGFQFQIQNFRF